MWAVLALCIAMLLKGMFTACQITSLSIRYCCRVYLGTHKPWRLSSVANVLLQEHHYMLVVDLCLVNILGPLR